jgi:serine/threonine-protein kinase RsbW
VTHQRAVRLKAGATYQDVRTIDQALVDLLVGAGDIDETTIHSIELAVHEVATNIVDHAYPDNPAGQIEASLTVSGGAMGAKRRLAVELSDTGLSFDASTVTPVNFESPQEGGYGLFLAQALMDEVYYERKAGRNIWRLTKRL